MDNNTLHYLERKAVLILLIGLVFLILGEIIFRLPSAPQLLKYVSDKELGYRYAPNQIYSSFLGNYSVETSPITIGGHGFRNGPIDWNRPIILVLGSSEVVGPGLRDEEIWTARLTTLLSDETHSTPLVVNAGVGGYGPYHSSVVLQRFFEENQKPLLVIIRVSIGDRLFFPPKPYELRTTKLRKFKTFIYRYSAFLPFLYKKITAQIYSIKNAISLNRNNKVLSYEYEKAEAAETMWKDHKAYWNKIAILCEKNSVFALFYISDPYGTPGGKRLFEKFKSHFGNRPFVSVFIINEKYFGILDKNLSSRRNEFKERFTLGYDPHANCLQHKVVADTLFSYLSLINTRPLNFPNDE